MENAPIDFVVAFGKYLSSFRFDSVFFQIYDRIENGKDQAQHGEWGEWQNSRHSHAAYEAQYIYQGSYNLAIGNNDVTLNSGSLLLIAPNTFHSPPLRTQLEGIKRFCFRFTLAKAKTTDAASPINLESNSISMALASISRYRVIDFSTHEILFHNICKELQQREPGYAVRCTGYLLVLLSTISSSISGYEAQRDLVESKDDISISVIDNFFLNHYNLYGAEEILAKQLSIGKRKLNYILLQNYNKNFRQKLVETRMEIANDMLARTNYSNAKIAEHLGYSSESAFYNTYKNYNGMTPHAYRRLLKGNKEEPSS